MLSHYDAVLWHLGDNRLTQDPEDALTSTPIGELPDLAVAERQQYLTLAVRDFLNESGKLVHAGESLQQHQPARPPREHGCRGLLAGGSGLGIAWGAHSWPLLVTGMAVLGVSNAACQVTSNLTLTQAVPVHRRGLGFGVKK